MGKYESLTQWLKKCPGHSVKLSFKELEEILGFALPESAYVHSRWWMNDPNHSQAKGWLDAGYTTVNSHQPISAHSVEFVRGLTEKREQGVSPAVIKTNRLNQPAPAASIPPQLHGANDIITIDQYVFFKTPFALYEKDIPSPFLQYSGPLVRRLLDKKYYKSLKRYIEMKYPQFLNEKIQTLMQFLISEEDPVYLKFLNKNGSDLFCRFGLTDKNVFSQKGLYLYKYVENITYIGRCRDNYLKRFNINYGTIQPINCYKEGQSTNTHMNALMNKYGDNISIFLCPLVSDDEIVIAEKKLIRLLKPIWNRKD